MSFGKSGASNTAIPQAVAKQTNQTPNHIWMKILKANSKTNF